MRWTQTAHRAARDTSGPGWLAGSRFVAVLGVTTWVVACTGTVVEPRGGGVGEGACVPGIPVTSRIPTLTHEQLENTVGDLVRPGIPFTAALPPQSLGAIDQRSWDGYVLAAETIAAAAVADEGTINAIAPCAAGTSEDTCARTFIDSFGRRAFRRTLSADEVTRLTAMFSQRAELTDTGSYRDGIQLLIEAMLQTPTFLLRAERSSEVANGNIPLNDFEVASRLSYMLWNTMPDDALLDAAEAGQLSTPEEIRAQAVRMLEAPPAREMVATFHRRFFGIDGSDAARWAEIVRDPVRYPDLTPAMVPLLTAETLAFVDYIVFEQRGGYRELLTEPTGFVNRDLAPLYGLDPGAYGDELEPVALDPTQRSGVFTRLGFLASHAMYDRTSPILRGAFIQKHVLCTPIGSPPIGADATPLPEPDPSLVTTRQRVDLQTSSPDCAGCHHTLINPAGYSFEHYDALGRWRDDDNGASVDSGGSVSLGQERVGFDDAIEMSAAIAENQAAHACYVRQWVEYASARDLSPQDNCVVNDLAARLGEENYSVLDLLVELTQVESFSHRAVEVTP